MRHEGELQYLQQLRWSAAVLAASEKECYSACGTGAAPPIVPGLVTGWGLAASSKGATAAAWAPAMWRVRCGLHLLSIVLGLVTGRGLAASSCSVTAAATRRVAAEVGIDVCPPSVPLFGRTEGIGCVPMQNLLLLADPEALGVCPCRIYYLSQKRKALGVCPCKIYHFDRTEYIGGACVHRDLHGGPAVWSSL